MSSPELPAMDAVTIWAFLLDMAQSMALITSLGLGVNRLCTPNPRMRLRSWRSCVVFLIQIHAIAVDSKRVFKSSKFSLSPAVSTLWTLLLMSHIWFLSSSVLVGLIKVGQGEVELNEV